MHILTVGDVPWTINIDHDRNGYIICAIHGAEKRYLQVKKATVDQMIQEKPKSDATSVIMDNLQLRPNADGSMALHLKSQISLRALSGLPKQTGSSRRLEDYLDLDRPLTAGNNLPKVASKESRRNTVMSTSSLQQLPPLETTKSPPKQPSTTSAATSWAKLKKVIRRMPAFELEEALLQNPHDLKLRIDLGLRYSEEPATQVTAMILLEQASFYSDHSSAGWRFWGALGDIHYALLQRYARHHRCFVFHLERCTDAYDKALSFIENAADTSIIVKYATTLFMKGDRELPYELLKSLSLTYASNGTKLGPADIIQRLFLLFRVTLANNLMHQAIGHMTKLIALATDVSYLPIGYTLNDCHLMLARCCQIEGDYLFATNTFSRVLSEKYGPASIYSDEQYLSLWQGLASTSYHQGNMWLCIEYCTLALTYAKHMPTRAGIYYRRGLSYFCINEPIKAEDDYRRAKSACHDLKPEVTLQELRRTYKEEFDKLMDTSVADLIAQVRKGMGKTTASIKVQRHFRQFIHRKRRQQESSRMLMRLPTGHRNSISRLLSIGEGESATGPNKTTLDEPSPRILTQEEIFAARRESALESLQKLHMSCLNLPATTPMQELNDQMQSISFLTPDFDRPDYRRHRSIASYRRLGYSTGDVSCVLHWKAVLQCGVALYRSNDNMRRNIAQVQFFHKGIADDVAFCALADSDGQVDEASGKLCNPKYRSEIECVCCVIDVHEWMTQPPIEPLPGAPEIDPDTGKFYVHKVHSLELDHQVQAKELVEEVKPEECDILVRMKRGRRKEKSFRVGHIISSHSSKELFVPEPLEFVERPQTVADFKQR